MYKRSPRQVGFFFDFVKTAGCVRIVAVNLAPTKGVLTVPKRFIKVVLRLQGGFF